MVCSTGLLDSKLGSRQDLQLLGFGGGAAQQDSFPVLPGPLPEALPQEMTTPLPYDSQR